jgi:SulP family sulfate permease
VAILRIHGPLLFGTTRQLLAVLDDLAKLPPIVIVRLRNMTALDATGLQALEEFAERVLTSGRHVLLCGARPQPARVIQQSHLDHLIGAENLCPHIQAALERAVTLREHAHEPKGAAS